MNPRYVGWVVIKSIMGSLLMFDSFYLAMRSDPGVGIGWALIETGNASTFFIGFFLVFSALIGGVGILTWKYHLKDEENAKVVVC